MPRTILQTLNAHKAAQRKEAAARRAINTAVVRAARKVIALERQADKVRIEMQWALTHLNDPGIAPLDTIIQRQRERAERIVPRSRKVRPVGTLGSKPSDGGPEMPVYAEESLYHMMLIARMPWDHDKQMVFTTERLEPTYRPTYYTGDNNEYRFEGWWELPHYPYVQQLEKQVFKLYQDMWSTHRCFIGWSLLDPYWGAGTNGINERGSFCYAPEGRILVRDDEDIKGHRYIGSVNSTTGLIEISEHYGAGYEYLDGRLPQDVRFILDQLILGEAA